MDVYWSVDSCSWEPCAQEPAARRTPGTGWQGLDPDPEPAPPLPQQRTLEPAAVDA